MYLDMNCSGFDPYNVVVLGVFNALLITTSIIEPNTSAAYPVVAMIGPEAALIACVPEFSSIDI
jgi:hypothetical protein